MYVEKEDGLSTEVQFAELMSPVLPLTANGTFSGIVKFWYYFGLGTGTLQVHTRNPDSWVVDDESLLWTVTHSVATNYQRTWRQVSVPVCVSDRRSLVFHVELGRVFSIIALDEVVVTRDLSKLIAKPTLINLNDKLFRLCSGCANLLICSSRF